MEKMRRRPDAGRGNESIRNQFQFMETCCEVAQLDLTDFFEKWGFFHVGDIRVKDYRDYHFRVTQEMVDKIKSHIAAREYQKPDEDITLVAD